MYDVIDCTNWNVWDDGMSEGSGRSEKEWLVSDVGKTCLFKYPKSAETTEHISEHLACQIGKIVGIDTAEVDLGIRNGRMGSISYQINNSHQDLWKEFGLSAVDTLVLTRTRSLTKKAVGIIVWV